MSSEKRLSKIVKTVGDSCLTVGRIDPQDVRCRTCNFVRLCVEARSLLPKESRQSSGRTRNWIGKYEGTVEMNAIYQRIADQIDGFIRPMRPTKYSRENGIRSYAELPWNDSGCTIYEYQNVLVDNGLAVGRNRVPFMILFDQFPVDLCIYLKSKVERMQEAGVLAKGA